jgi:hypothetical protein
MAKTLSITLYAGVNYPAIYKHTDGAGNAVSLAGCTVFYTIKPKPYDDDSNDGTATYKTSATITDPAQGLATFDVLIPATGIPAGKQYFDIVVQLPGGKKLPPVLIGEVDIKRKRTNRSL